MAIGLEKVSFPSIPKECSNYCTIALISHASKVMLKIIQAKKNKEPLEESEKVGLKLSIQKTKTMASGPITSQQIDGETMERVTDFILGAPKSLQMLTAAMKLKDACSLEEKL